MLNEILQWVAIAVVFLCACLHNTLPARPPSPTPTSPTPSSAGLRLVTPDGWPAEGTHLVTAQLNQRLAERSGEG